MKTIRFDDIDTLRQQVSSEFGPWSEPIDVSQELIDGFSDLTGDDHWIHIDNERSRRESPFGEPIAHGLLTLSLFSKLPGDGSFEVVGHGNSANYGLDRVRFLSPVPAGSQLRARARVAEVTAKPRGTLLAREVEVRVVGHDQPAMLCRPLTLFQKAVEA